MKGDVIYTDRGPAGNLMYTSDVYLQDAGFYTFSSNGKIGKTEMDIDNNTRESSQHFDPKMIRQDNASGRYFFIGVSPNDKNYNGLSDSMRSVYEKFLFMNGPAAGQFSREDTNSDTSYEMQNIEYIAYYANKPNFDSQLLHNDVWGKYDNVTSSGAWGAKWTPKMLGCYAVQNIEGGVNFQDTTRPISFVWLVHFNVKMAYPVMRVFNNGMLKMKAGMFGSDLNIFYDGSGQFWYSMTETFVR